jgi:hypothetical protein
VRGAADATVIHVRTRRQAIERKLKRGQVRISFDIDDTLACLPEHAAAEDSKLPGSSTAGSASPCAAAPVR